VSKKSDQQGFVSIFSVIFFAMLSSVITVGFIRIMVMEQQQALDNDLTARALSAAEAGVEDAKRAIAFYAGLPDTDTRKADAAAALNSTTCNAINSSVLFQTSLGVRADGVISDTNHQDMKYKCLSVNLKTPDYEGYLAAADDTVTIPLVSDGDLKGMTLRWHYSSVATSSDSDGPVANLPTAGNTRFPTQKNFAYTAAGVAKNTPAYIRLQLIGVPKTTSFNMQDIDQRSRTVFVAPTTTGVSSLDLQTADSRPTDGTFYKDGTKDIPVPASCNTTDQYACSIPLVMPADSASTNYYLRITALYRGNTHIKLDSLTDGTTPLSFQNVQPVIDSTGVAADVFRRIQVRTNFPGVNFDAPRYGLESGQTLCKDFAITDAGYIAGSCTP
jgi:hypothetical protein